MRENQEREFLIKKITKSSKKDGKFIISFSDESEIIVSEFQIADFGLYSGLKLSEDEFSDIKGSYNLSNSKSSAPSR